MIRASPIDFAITCTWPARKPGRGALCGGFAGRIVVPRGMIARVVDHVQHSGDARAGLFVVACTRCARLSVVKLETLGATG